MMKLFDRETSGNAYKARLLLSFLGVPHETVPVPLKDGRNQVDDEYLRLNPRGQIPTLVDGDAVVWGSTAVLCYIASKFDASGRWLPTDPLRLAHVMQWLELAQNEVQSGLFLARAIARFGYAGDLPAAQQLGKAALEVLESRLGHAPWLAGPGPTIADIACFPYAALATEGGLNLSRYAGVRRWLASFKGLDGFVAMPGI